MQEITDRMIDRFFGEYERPQYDCGWPYEDEELDREEDE